MSTVRKVYAILSPAERKAAIVLLGLMTIGAVLETLGLGLVVPAIAVLMQRDLATQYPELQPLLSALGNPSQPRLVAIGMLALVGMYFVKTTFCGFLVWRQTHFVFGLQARLSDRLFSLYLSLPYTFHLEHNSAQLIRNSVNEVSQFTQTTALPGLLLLTEGLVLFGIASLLFVLEPMGAVIVVAVMGSTAWGYQRITGSRVTRWGEARQYHDGLRIQHLQQGIGAAKDVKLLGREEEFLAQYRVHNMGSARAARLHHTLVDVPRLGLELLGVAGLTALVLAMLMQGQPIAAIIPTLGLFAAAAFRLMPSVNRVVNAIHLLRYGLTVVDTLHAELARATTPTGVRQAKVQPFRDSIVLRDVIYSYPNASAPALSGLSISIQRGEFVGFVGPSGSGKSTLVDVVLGLLTPDAGEVLVDGRNIQSALRGWQDQIGYVPQSIYLTDDTIRRNIAFGLPNEKIDDSAVRRAVKAAQLEDFVASRPDGLATVLGEHGVRLSGGQRQRIGIARALYHDPAVLVLDEATSALDTVTEEGVMEAVIALHGSKTILVVAHRLSTVEHCDRKYRLEHGQVVRKEASVT
jgi:ABC-type multidrug transport system fused ATPase/permease subunit